MAIERTFAIINPDAVGRNIQGEIFSRIHKAGFKIIAIKSMRLTKAEAGGFYAVHRERPFFGELTDFMSSGKIFAMVLEAEGAIGKWRDTMGATDPKKATCNIKYTTVLKAMEPKIANGTLRPGWRAHSTGHTSTTGRSQRTMPPECSPRWRGKSG